MTVRVLIAATCLALVLAACSSNQSVMLPVAVDPGQAKPVNMLVATTRQPTSDRSLMFTGERGEGVSLANVVVSVPPADRRQPGTIQWPTGTRPDPATSFITLEARDMPDAEVPTWFRREAGPRRRALIFVHGFNTGFADATFRLAQLAHDLGTQAAPVLFTWPSKGNALDYVYDRESTIYSRSALVTLLKAAIASRDVGEIVIVSHSMGSWLTMEALREIGLRAGRLSPKVKTVVLASPDIDVDVFRRQVLEMGPARPKFLLVSSRNDVALALSRFVAGDVDRLGAADLRTHQALLERYGIELVDATDASQADPLGHNAFAESGPLLRSIGETLNGGAKALPLRWQR